MNSSLRITLVCLCLGIGVAGCGGGSGIPGPVGDEPSPPGIGSDASLAKLSTSGTGFDQIFQPTLFEYTGTASYLVRYTSVVATASDADASISINGAPVASGEPSDPVALDVGTNLITVTVTAGDGETSKSYSISLDRKSAATLAQQAYIKASNTGGGDRFGGAVALSGNLLAVAARREDSGAAGINADALDDSAPDAGAVYVFRRDAANSWAQDAYIKASNAEIGDGFGRSIALSGNTLAVGAFREDSATTAVDGDASDNSAVDAGAVYVFTRDATGLWSQQAYIKASNAEPGDEFGASLALSGDTLAVGAHFEDSMATGVDGDPSDNSSENAGAVYVFTRDTAARWTQRAYLKASNTDAGDRFGAAVALSNDTLAVAAPEEASNSTGIGGSQTNNSWPGAGAVYVFARDDADTWTQQAYGKASNTDGGDRFGAPLALSADTLAVGAPLEDSAATGVNGIERDNKAQNSGAAYVFARDAAGLWSQQAYVKASNSDIQDQFGLSVRLGGDFLLVGALEDSAATGVNGDQTDNNSANSGAVYLFARDVAGSWRQAAYVKASNTDPFDGFGGAAAVDGSSIVIGAELEDSSATGVGGDQSDGNTADSGAVYIID